MSKERDLNNTINKGELMNICKILKSDHREHGFFSITSGIVTKIYHILLQKYISKFHKGEILQTTFSDHKADKLEITNKKCINLCQAKKICICNPLNINWYNKKKNHRHLPCTRHRDSEIIIYDPWPQKT